MAKTSLTSVGNSADLPARLLKPSPATGHDADTRDVEDPNSGYDVARCPYHEPPRQMRSPSRAGLFKPRQNFRYLYGLLSTARQEKVLKFD
jgi:hypothetical protein